MKLTPAERRKILNALLGIKPPAGPGVACIETKDGEHKCLPLR